MKQFYFRLIRLILGLILYALGIVLTLRADIGYAPWEVFHAGLSETTGISFGTVTIIVGVLIAIVTVALGEKIGLGSILNMFLIGIFLDILLEFNIVPEAGTIVSGIVMIIAGLFIIAIASYFYIKSAFGTGPRDSLMVVLARKTKLPIGLCRGTIELLAVLIGWSLGGMVGIGTIISAFAVGFCVQITFKLFRFDATEVKHETLDQTCKMLFIKKKRTT